jgi:large subunit ribosomal protein L18e
VEHNDTVIIPGTLLGSGSTDKPIIVAAMKVTHSARQKICDAGGSVLTLRELIMQNPNGKGIKIIG